MSYDCFYQTPEQWIRIGNLVIDLNSLKEGFLDTERRRQEIWDYLQYRESLVSWPPLQRQT